MKVSKRMYCFIMWAALFVLLASAMKFGIGVAIGYAVGFAINEFLHWMTK